MLRKPTFDTSVSQQSDNIALIDWLTVVCYGLSLEEVKYLIGLSHAPWDNNDRYMNGYPARLYFGGINILYGADDPELVKTPRNDMGICINMSGQGCRSFETYSTKSWNDVIPIFFTLTDYVKEKNGRRFSYNITRLDIAFDDHTGLFDLPVIAQKVKEREYLSPSKYSEITYSDQQEDDLQGLSVYIGSAASDIRFRFYDKAAERGFKDRHWVRLEMQLRDERATMAAHNLVLSDIGSVFKGICNHYITFVDPGLDTNKSRWEVSPWWNAFLEYASDISLVVSPGVEYNLSKTEFYLFRQYGQAMFVLSSIYDDAYILKKVKDCYSLNDLDPKYKRILDQAKLGGFL